jgi:hypothetical protein
VQRTESTSAVGASPPGVLSQLFPWRKTFVMREPLPETALSLDIGVSIVLACHLIHDALLPSSSWSVMPGVSRLTPFSPA